MIPSPISSSPIFFQNSVLVTRVLIWIGIPATISMFHSISISPTLLLSLLICFLRVLHTSVSWLPFTWALDFQNSSEYFAWSNNDVVYIVLILHLIPMPSSPLQNNLRTATSVQISVNSMLHIFLGSLHRVRVDSLFTFLHFNSTVNWEGRIY